MNEESKSYEVSLPEGASWVLVRVYRPVSFDVGRGMMKEAIGLAKRHGLSSFLHDVTGAPSILNATEQYQFAHFDLKDFGFDQNSKKAILVSEGDTTRDFMVTVLRNAGYNCRLFTSRAEAIRWLSQSE